MNARRHLTAWLNAALAASVVVAVVWPIVGIPTLVVAR